MHVSPAVVDELKRIIQESEIVKSVHTLAVIVAWDLG